MAVKIKLAKFEPVPDGESCITYARLEEMFRGATDWTIDEEIHLLDCYWCRHNALHGTDECLSIKQILAYSFGARPTSTEAAHLADCPLCAYEYIWARKEMKKTGVETAEAEA